jgi:hypothetical protein
MAEPKSRSPEAPLLYDAQGRERPRFVAAAPEHEGYRKLLASFERGDYASLRREAPKLLEGELTPEVRAATLELLERIEPDPLVRWLLVLTATLLAWLIWHARQH